MRRYLFFRYRKLHWFFIIAWLWVALTNWKSYKPEASLAQKLFGLVAITFIWLATMVILFAAWKIIAYLTGGRFRPSVGPHTYEISEDGFVELNTDGKKEIKISGIKRVAENGSYFFIFSNTGMGYVIPKKDLPNFDALQALKQRVSCKPKPT
jgi:hypothetical protein